MSIKQLSKKEYEAIKQNNQNIIDLKINYVKIFEGIYKGQKVYMLYGI